MLLVDLFVSDPLVLRKFAFESCQESTKNKVSARENSFVVFFFNVFFFNAANSTSFFTHENEFCFPVHWWDFCREVLE